MGIGTRYRPAQRGHEVGGDWYDVFELPDGKIGCAAGDVAGHDLAAAVAMGRLQLLLRYTARSGAQPAAVLAALDQACPELSAGVRDHTRAGQPDRQAGRPARLVHRRADRAPHGAD